MSRSSPFQVIHSHAKQICFHIPLEKHSNLETGGSSLEGNFSAPYGGISVDFAFMDKIIRLNEDDMDVVVQPSVSWMGLNRELESSGLFFPVSNPFSRSDGWKTNRGGCFSTLKTSVY